MGNLSTLANYVEQLQQPQKQVLLKLIDLKVDGEMKEIIRSIQRLEERMDAKFERVDAKFEQMQTQMDIRFEHLQMQMDVRFDSVEKRFNMLFWLLGIFSTFITAGLLKSLFF